MRDRPAAQATGARLLVADDDEGVRLLLGTLLRATAGVGSVLEAADGVEAVNLAREQRPDIVVLDFNMPRLDGLQAALRLRALQPSLPIALQSSDPELLRRRAAGLELPLFDKVDFERVLGWAERQARDRRPVSAPVTPLERRRDLCCSPCGYGIVSRTPPGRCPFCGAEGEWVEPSGWSSRRAALHERRAVQG